MPTLDNRASVVNIKHGLNTALGLSLTLHSSLTGMNWEYIVYDTDGSELFDATSADEEIVASGTSLTITVGSDVITSDSIDEGTYDHVLQYWSTTTQKSNLFRGSITLE